MNAGSTVAILGASADEQRYAFKAQRLLKQKGHRVIPVNARQRTIDGDQTVASLAEIDQPVDTLTVYVRPSVSSRCREDIERLNPGRVIFNPGTENPTLAEALVRAGIRCEEECTMVLLRSGHF